jgi:hypothetical protein
MPKKNDRSYSIQYISHVYNFGSLWVRQAVPDHKGFLDMVRITWRSLVEFKKKSIGGFSYDFCISIKEAKT